MNFKKLCIYPGFDKNGIREQFESIEMQRGYVYTIVGPTGSGKSQFLEDIELLSDCDGVTKRRVESTGTPLIAHLSQKMNYMVDMTVEEFILLRGKCLGIQNHLHYLDEILNLANRLSGEAIHSNMHLTKLSGGQSRSLMIADIANNPQCNIVLLDEIENAGLDKRRVIEILLIKDKLVILITHDPLLALLGDYRIVFKNGGIQGVIKRDNQEKQIVKELIAIDNRTYRIQAMLRKGLTLEEVI